MESYFHARYQMVVINGKTSFWEAIKAGVPQRLVIDTRMF